DESRDVRTDAHGAFKVPVSSGRDLLLELSPRGTVKGQDVAPLVFERDVLEAGSTWDLGADAVTFQREVVLAEGVVTDRGGDAVANASVTALPIGQSTRALTTRSDASGQFVVKGPPDVREIDLFASTENDAARLPGPTASGAKGIKLALAPAGRIAGSIAPL